MLQAEGTERYLDMQQHLNPIRRIWLVQGDTDLIASDYDSCRGRSTDCYVRHGLGFVLENCRGTGHLTSRGRILKTFEELWDLILCSEE